MKLVILANSFQALRKCEKVYNTTLVKICAYQHDDNDSELNIACGRCYRVCPVSVIDPSNSDIRNMPEWTNRVNGRVFFL